jgi:hypothetical protein
MKRTTKSKLPDKPAVESELTVQPVPQSRVKRTLRVVRNILISTIVLAVLVVGAGVAYTWYMSRQPVSNLEAAPEPQSLAPIITPKKSNPNAKVGVSIESLSTPIPPGGEGSLIIKTNPDASCDIVITHKNTPPAKDTKVADDRLSTQIADEFGVVNWTWNNPMTPVGAWKVKVTCTLGEHSGVVQADLVVK